MNIIVDLLQVSKCICKPLDLIFQSCRKLGKFPTEWENVVPVHNKEDRQILSINVSLFLICGKHFERLIYDKLFECLITTI